MESFNDYTYNPKAEAATRAVLGSGAGGTGHTFGPEQTPTRSRDLPVPNSNHESGRRRRRVSLDVLGPIVGI